MGSNGDEARNDGAGSGKEEKTHVSVRMRPLNSKEIERNDHSDWDVINNTTIIFKNNLPDRSMPPSAYTYDRAFGCNCDTRKVYEEGAKEVALSAVSGINSSIFAYGQTSSGKTYTMRGITEYFVDDIYDYIGKHEEREFRLKFSAMEIYNEAVKDLLSSDDTHLRLLDDPERGTVVEKLTEETLRDKSHLKELLAICEVQRQIGETYLNEASSRSHQILKLTVESLAKQFRASTLAATVNFIDLAGSERASQTLSAGTRLKEGSHINRSLLTLGTVIRKLSKGRNAHVPYRDSKLTRILQNSLGGNARTAIICTMSPARSHIEQSRNTLLFASCAKEVATSARVNVVMSDKALVKHLKSELARLEDELRYVGSVHKTTDANELKEKDAKIIKMEKEIMQLIQQRDLAQLRLNDLLGSVTDDQSSLRLGEYGGYSVRHARNPSDDVHSLRHWEESSEVSAQLTPNSQAFRQWDEYAQLPVYRVGTSEDESSMSEASGICYQSPEFGISKLRISSHVSSNYDANPPPSLPLNSSYAPEIASETSEDQCKEVRCIEASDFSNKDEFGLLLSEDCDSLIPHFLNADVKEDLESSLCSLGKDLAVLRASSASGTDAETPLQRLEKSEISFDRMVWLPGTSLLDEDVKFQDTGAGPKAQHTGACEHKLRARHSSKTSSEKGIPTMSNFVQELKELAQDQYQKQLSKKLDCAQEIHQSIEHCNEVKIRKDAPTSEPTSVLPLEFERLQREITELWDTCNVSLIHRTYFFLLFRGGEPADSVYMEVERRRLSFLKKKLPQDCRKCQTLSSSIKNLRHERDMLHRRMLKRLSLKEREELYLKWGIELRSKQRRMQVVQLLWTDAKDMEHVRESALLVAKLIGLVEPEQALKEMFGFTFTPQKTHRRSFSWNRISSFRSAQ